MSIGPIGAYRAWLAEGRLRPDPQQQLAVEKLQSLHHALLRYRPSSGEKGWRERFGLARRREEPAPPQGLYLYGGVGRGKSMLMDMFFTHTPVEHKRRVHFHDFMLQIHRALHDWRKGGFQGEDDPIPPLAREIAQESWLLCFDEFQVHDIADAMILGRLFQALFAQGVVVVATSNRHPDDLYKDGLQRDKFLPFIALFKERLDLLALDGPTDYRLERVRGLPVFYAPLGAETSRRLDRLFLRLSEGAPPEAQTLLVQGRRLVVPQAASGVARFTFPELCAEARGAADYLALATHYHTLVIDGVPRMTREARNEAKRFVTLIDALYEHRVNLVMGADGRPQELYPAGDGSFEFERTVSRLIEMQSYDYMTQPHLA